VRHAVDDWLAYGLADRSEKTVSTRREVVTPLADLIGAVKLRDLTAADVRHALEKLAMTRATRTAQDAHNCLVRAIRYAERATWSGATSARSSGPRRLRKAGHRSR